MGCDVNSYKMFQTEVDSAVLIQYNILLFEKKILNYYFEEK